MNYDELNALRNVLDYMWNDEKRNYEEVYDIKLDEDLTKVDENSSHIFVSMCTLGNYIQVYQCVFQEDTKINKDKIQTKEVKVPDIHRRGYITKKEK